jgi:hypothetical protein
MMPEQPLISPARDSGHSINVPASSTGGSGEVGGLLISPDAVSGG